MKEDSIQLQDGPLNLERPRAIIYVRVSSPSQVKRGDGLASQEATCRQYAQIRGYEVLEVFRDNVTGGRTDRPAIQALLRYLRKNRSKGLIVIVDHPNRFSRDMRGHWDLRDMLKSGGARLESPNMKFGDSPAEILLENVTMSASQYQREQNAEQTRDRMRGRLLNGFWPFVPPRGMRHKRVEGMGNVLVRVEPEASVIAEGLEAFASGRLRTQAEFARYLDQHPDYDKGRSKGITHQQAHILLTNPIYAGVIQRPEWDIGPRKGRHRGLISFETFQRIQDRLNGNANAPARADISDDFPLRGSVTCAHCGHGLTSCWSTSKTGAKHPYYMCFARGCDRYRKSIRREALEADFEALLNQLVPKPVLLKTAKALFENAWEQRTAQLGATARSYERQLAELDKQISVLLDRVVSANSTAIMNALERRVGELEGQRLLLAERRSRSREKPGSFEELFELPFAFISNPLKLWHFGKLEYRKTVLRLAFSDRLAYSPDEGFRTPKTTMPFSMLGDVHSPFERLAERKTAMTYRQVCSFCFRRQFKPLVMLRFCRDVLWSLSHNASGCARWPQARMVARVVARLVRAAGALDTNEANDTSKRQCPHL